MKFVLASQNAHKLQEMQAILAAQGVEVVLERDIGLHVEVEETGSTFGENALLKAKAVMEKSGLPAIADDSGICVDALNGAPGVYSARYGGEELDDVQRYRLLLEMLRGQTNRAAHFTSHITCCFPNGDIIDAEGTCPGTIAFAPQGTGGFGYDPVFFVPQLRKTYAQLTPEEKAAAWEDFEPLCLHDSSLSFATHALFAAQNGPADAAERYWEKALWLDLRDIMGNTGKEGLHLACLGETWQTLVFGFAGLHLTPDGPALAPHLPERWRSLSFRFTHRGRSYEARVSRDEPTELIAR